jgi:hypothetical protein
MLTRGRDNLYTAPHVTAFPGLALATTVLAFNLFGDGVRDLLDPHAGGGAEPPRETIQPWRCNMTYRTALTDISARAREVIRALCNRLAARSIACSRRPVQGLM